MVLLAFDEDVDHRILRGLQRRSSRLDVVTVQAAGLSGSPDSDVLAWAAAAGRVLVTADRNTLVGDAWRRVEQDEAMPGVLVVDRSAPLGSVIDDLLLIAERARADELARTVVYVPLPATLTSRGRRYR